MPYVCGGSNCTIVSLLTEPNVLWGSTWIVAKEELPFCCIAGKWLSLCEDASWWWKERVPQNFSLANLRLQILRGTGLPTTGKHWNNDIEAVPSTCSEKDCFSLAVENEVEVTWKTQMTIRIYCDMKFSARVTWQSRDMLEYVTRRSPDIGSIVCCWVVSYQSIF